MSFERLNLETVSYHNLDVASPALVRVKIDSDIAKKMLELNMKNRRVRRTAVEYLKQQIANNEWRDDHPQPIIFSSTGRLIDGQHRLYAISEMGINAKNALTVRVETGARDDVREYLDTGVPRTLDDRVEFCPDLRRNKTIAQIINFAKFYGSRNSRSKTSPEAAKEYYCEHKNALDFISSEHRSDKGVCRIQIAFAAMEYFEISRQHAIQFYPSLFIVDSPIQQVRILRDCALRSASVKNDSAFSRLDIYYKSISAMKAHMQGRDVMILRKSTW